MRCARAAAWPVAAFGGIEAGMEAEAERVIYLGKIGVRARLTDEQPPRAGVIVDMRLPEAMYDGQIVRKVMARPAGLAIPPVMIGEVVESRTVSLPAEYRLQFDDTGEVSDWFCARVTPVEYRV